MHSLRKRKTLRCSRVYFSNLLVKAIPYWDISELNLYRKYWMFTNPSMDRVEILPPTLQNLTLMREGNLCWVIKGFKNKFEYRTWERIRVKHGFCSMMYVSRSVGSALMFKAISAMLNNQPLPSKEEVDQEIEKNRLIPIKDNISEERVKEREKYKRLYEKWTKKAQYNFSKLLKQFRVKVLS